MRVIINRNLCGHHPAGCEKCFGEFLLKGAVPDRGCILDIVDDGKAAKERANKHFPFQYIERKSDKISTKFVISIPFNDIEFADDWKLERMMHDEDA